MRAPVVLLAAMLLAPAADAQGGGAAAWLAGCWEGSAGERSFEERWSPARGGTLAATARSFRGGRTTSVELAVIRMDGDTLRYHAYPVGQAPAVFSAARADSAALVFENRAHDFPRRIIYRRVGADSLHARIEGPDGDEWRGIDFPMARVRCDP